MKPFWYIILILMGCFQTINSVIVSAAEEEENPEATDKTAKPENPVPVKTFEVIKRPLLDNEKQLMQDIADSSPAKQVMWLETENGDKFLTLFMEELTGTPRGSVVLLHSRSTIFNKTLKHDLSEHGWNTLTVFLPAVDKEDHRLPPHTVIDAFKAKAATLKQENVKTNSKNNSAEGTNPDNEATADGNGNNGNQDNNEDSENQENINSEALTDSSNNDLSLLTSSKEESNNNTLSEADSLIIEEDALQKPKEELPTLDIVMNRINAAFKFIADQGNANIVLIAESIHATWALCDLNFRNDHQLKPDISALVMINGLNLFHSPELTLSYLISKQHLPILDIYQDSIGTSSKQAKKRFQAARRTGLNIYHQIQMPELSYHWLPQNNPLSKRIRGWLQKHATIKTSK